MQLSRVARHVAARRRLLAGVDSGTVPPCAMVATIVGEQLNDSMEIGLHW